MKNHVPNALLIASVAVAGLLYGCTDGSVGTVAGNGSTSAGGGGGGGSTPGEGFYPGTDIPLSATTSPAGAFTFVNGLVSAGGNDTGEPLRVGDATLATSETEEPNGGV